MTFLKSKKNLFILSAIILVFLFLMADNYFFKRIKPSSPNTNNKPQNTDNMSVIDQENQIAEPFSKYIPQIFNDGLEANEITRRNADPLNTAREVTTSKGMEEVSILDGYRVLYSYPETNYFAKMHVEQSKKDEYENDKIKVLSELDEIAKGSPIKNEKLSNLTYYHLGNETLDHNVLDMTLVFFPDDQIIATIYFLNQQPEERKFKTIEEFNSLRNNFMAELNNFVGK